MSEIQDAAQIIRVSLEGAEILLRIGKCNWEFVKGICAVFSQMLDQEKLAGKTSVKKLLKSGGDLQVFKFRSEDLQKVRKMADKYGLLYSVLPDLNKKDGMCEILFHSQAVPRIKSIMEQIQEARIESMDDYFSHADRTEVGKMVQEYEKDYERAKSQELHTGLGTSPDASIENATPSDKRKEIRRFQKEYVKNSNVNGITIARKLVMEETGQGIKTRIPYRENEYIWLPKSEITWIHKDKTVYAGLEKEREYQIVDAADRLIRKVTGQELYQQSYDPVNRNVEGREQERIRRRRDQKQRKAQQTETGQDQRQQKAQQNEIRQNQKQQKTQQSEIGRDQKQQKIRQTEIGQDQKQRKTQQRENGQDRNRRKAQQTGIGQAGQQIKTLQKKERIIQGQTIKAPQGRRAR